jgi:nicotinamide-nucleotide amidase
MSLFQSATQLGQRLLAEKLKITTVESCTGGGIAQAITSIAGSSAWFDMGFITYSNEAKICLVSVKKETLDVYGAVSAQTVAEMAQGALRMADADIAVATSGVAGPGGGSTGKPVGTVWFAWATSRGVKTEKCQFDGDRQSVQAQATLYAIDGVHKKSLDCCM